MAKIVEFHVLQQFAPGNLNRDDTGAPKDAYFGGVRRARISSQSFKRAVRRYFAAAHLLSAEELADRTKRIVATLCEKLKGRVPDPEKSATEVIELANLGLKKVKDALHTEYLLFIGHADIDRLADIAVDHAASPTSAEAKRAVSDVLRSNRAVDVALFGRMMADNKDFNVDAAAQVAHALSTHRVEREFDFFTAVDDLAASEEAVSGMLGTVDFNSACYYRYAVVNLDLLTSNLGGDGPMAERALGAFLTAFVRAVPSGKQNTFAAHNPPEFVAVRLRTETPMNLAGAFERPVGFKDGYLRASVTALQEQWARMDGAYGANGKSWVMDLSGSWSGPTVSSLEQLRNDLVSSVG